MKQCWIISEGAAGMENQALGLAEALGIKPICVKIPKPPLHNIVPPQMQFSNHLLKIVKDSAAKETNIKEYPSLVISCGHKAVAYAIALRQVNPKKTLTIHIQNPMVPSRFFDLIIAPAHDKISGKNIIETNGAIHRITMDKLAEAHNHFQNDLSTFPKPLILALVGGSTKRYKFDISAAKEIGKELKTLALRMNGSVILTTSRRTDPDCQHTLKMELENVPGSLWDGNSKNPYLGYLAHADYILVTCDSITMISEAVATGKPVYIFSLKGRGSSRFRKFYDTFLEAGYIKWYNGSLSSWDYAPPVETELAAKKVKKFLGERLLDLQQTI